MRVTAPPTVSSPTAAVTAKVSTEVALEPAMVASAAAATAAAVAVTSPPPRCCRLLLLLPVLGLCWLTVVSPQTQALCDSSSSGGTNNKKAGTRDCVSGWWVPWMPWIHRQGCDTTCLNIAWHTLGLRQQQVSTAGRLHRRSKSSPATPPLAASAAAVAAATAPCLASGNCQSGSLYLQQVETR
jgi:hypothetical protein